MLFAQLPEMGVIFFTAITAYYSLLGALILIGMKTINLKTAFIITGYSIILWIILMVMYINNPYLPTIYLTNDIIGRLQDTLILIFILTKTKTINVKIFPFIGVLAVSLLIHAMAFLFSNLPIPQIFLINVALGTTSTVLIWTYILIKTRVINSNIIPIILGYSILLWTGSLVMMLLNPPYFPTVYIMTKLIMPYSFLTLVFYYVDKYRLKR